MSGEYNVNLGSTEKRWMLDWNKANIIGSYFVAGSSKEATNTSVPSWSGRRNFNRSETSVEKY